MTAIVGVAAALIIYAAVGAASAMAGIGIHGADAAFTDSGGSPATQAGTHPFGFTTNFAIDSTLDAALGFEVPDEDLKDLRVDAPPGFLAYPTATPRCSSADFQNQQCPRGSTVGVVDVYVAGTDFAQHLAVFNLVPPSAVLARVGFTVLGVPVTVNLGVNPDPPHNGIATLVNVSQALPLLSSEVTLWGNPADPAHDAERGGPADFPAKAFLTLPRSCTGSLGTVFTGDSWQSSGAFATATATAPGMDSCEALGFDPAVAAGPSTTGADSPTGFDFKIDVDDPGLIDPSGTAETDLRKTVITLPEGIAVNPSAANGLGACSPAQLAAETATSDFGAGCPASSKVGSVDVETPVLDEPLTGSVFVATQQDNPFGSLLAAYIVIKSAQRGIIVKQAAEVVPDPVTGRLTTTVDDIPQLPFSRLTVHIHDGARAALASPPACGSYDALTQLTLWSGGAPIETASTFAIASGAGGGACPAADPAARPFAPSLSAGTISPNAGASSPFVLKLVRRDGEQAVKGFDLDLPPGLVAKLAGVAKCSEAAIAGIDTAVGSGRAELSRPSCPADSLLGSATVGSGVGPAPYFVQTGKVYFAGPYKGAPYSVAVVTPAVAGPFDLGTVVVRAALVVDPTTAGVTVKTDPLPTILAGIPLQVREIRTAVDRPGFMLNPTNCSPMAFAGEVRSDRGPTARIADRFQVGGCAGLGLSPKLAIGLTGKGQTTDNKHPGVHATVSQTAGQSNLKKVVVSLPLSLALDPDNANGLCEFADGSKVDPTCPKASIVGKATARTPILDQPLTGPVYFVKNIRKDPKSGREIRTLPKLVIPLTGENGLRLNLVGTSNVVNNRLVTTFDNIPDAPVSDFTLDIAGGKGGILVVSGTDICKASQVADQQIDGQNGKTAYADIYLQTTACPLKIISKKVGKTSVAVKVGGLGAGKVTVSGKGIKKTTKTISKSTVATITAKRTKGKPGKVTVSFDPTGPAKARKTTK